MTAAAQAFRQDLQVAARDDGHLDVRDPRRLVVYTLDRDYWEIGRLFDGKLMFAELAKRAAKALGRRVSQREVRKVAKELEGLVFLDGPAVDKLEPEIDNAAPHASLYGVERKLRVLPDLPPEGRWSCRACGACCHGLVVELNEEEDARIDASLYEDILGEGGYSIPSLIDPEQGPKKILRQKGEKRACIFLSDDGLCLIHARQGFKAKPDACQIFPYSVVHLPGRTPRLTMRVNCHTMSESWEDGAEPADAVADVRRLLRNHPSLAAERKVTLFGDERPLQEALDLYEAASKLVKKFGGVDRASLEAWDAELLQGRLASSRREFGRRMLAYLDAESESELPVEEGSLCEHFRAVDGEAGLGRARVALIAMSKGKKPPTVDPTVSRFLGRQARLVLFGLGPFQLPDVGLGLGALGLTLEASLHTAGRRKSLDKVHGAFMAFTTPVLENLAHVWPMLDALDAPYADHLRECYREAYLSD